MHKLTVLTFVVLAAFAITGCNDNSAPTGPTTVTTATGSAATLSVRPSTLVARPSDHFGCPAIPPFTVPFQLVVSSIDPGLVVTDITMRFVDTSGIQMPQVTLPAPLPVTPFGSALTEARDLPLSLALGCVTGHQGTLTVIVATRDGHGRAGSSELAVGVR